MADISKITLPNGSSYDIKDATARTELAGKAASSHTHTKSEVGLDNVDNTSDSNKNVYSAKKIQTYKQNSTTETYGDNYPLYAQWETNNILKLKCDNYTVKTDYSTSAGNATTVNGHTVNSDVPANAKFTDTWRGVQDNLTSTATDQSLSANQGRVLKGLIDGKAASSHGNHVPATQTANNAVFLRNDNTWQTVTPANIGAATSSHTHSAYVNQNAFSNVTVGSTTVSADSATDTLTLVAGSNVTLTPDATNDKITIAAKDTVYTHPTSSGNKHIPSGGSSGQILRWSADGTAVWGADNNTTYSVATTSANGLMSSSDKSKLDAITASADAVSFTSSLTSGTKVGTITINGTGTDLYAPTNTDTHYTTGLKVGASNTATANAAASNGSVYLNALDNTTVRDSHKITGSGATSVTSDANGVITISSTNTTYNAATQSANGLMSAADKKKLDGIASGANAYTLPTASSSTLGGVKTSSSVTDASGYTACPIISGIPYYKDTNTTYTLAGLMGSSAKGSATQPIYWNGSAWANTTYTLEKSVPSNAVFTDTNTHYTTHLYAGTSSGTANASTTNGNTYLILTDDSTARNRVKIAGSGATSVASDASGNITISSTNTTYSAATTSANGLMTSAMVTKLNSIATGATKNSVNTYDVSIAVADWATNSNGGYKCTKTVSGILATDEIFADVSLSSDVSAAKLQIAAWACVCNGNIFNSANNTVDFYCYDTKPSAALTIRLTVVR